MNKKNKQNKGKGPKPKNVKTKSTVANVAKTTLFRNKPPQIKHSAGKIIVKHTEFISDIWSGIDSEFKVNKFEINPGIKTMFVWLWALASQFESYKFRKLDFMLKTTSSTISPGTVAMAIDYDATDAAPLDKQAMMSYRNAKRSAPWQDISMSAAKSDLTKFARNRYVRIAPPPANTDLKTYDVGNLYIATSGTGSENKVLSELYVSYEVELETPQTSPQPVTAALTTYTGYSSVGITLKQPFGTTLVRGGLSDNFDLTKDTIKIKRPGRYFVYHIIRGTDVILVDPVLTDSPGTSTLPFIVGYSHHDKAFYSFAFEIVSTRPDATVKMELKEPGSTPTSVLTSTNVMITDFNNYS